jgi:hypothetical protein
MGEIAARFSRTDMPAVRLLLAGYTWAAAAGDLATVAALFGAAKKDFVDRAAVKAGREAAWHAGAPAFLLRKADPARVRALIADDYAELLLAFEAFSSHLAHGGLAAARQWCAGNGFSFPRFLALAQRREETLDDAVAAGLDPARAAARRLAAAADREDFLARLRGIKLCLLDALRCNLLRHGGGGRYTGPAGVRVDLPQLSPPPAYVVADTIGLVPGEGTALDYALCPNLVSVLSGHVPVDADFCGPRYFTSPDPPGPPDPPAGPPREGGEPSPSAAAGRLAAYHLVVDAAFGAGG